MLGFYMLAAILGGGWFLLSLVIGGDHDATDADVSGMDAGHDFDVGHDVDVSHDIHVDHDVAAGHAGAPGQLLLGFLRPRNVIFFLTAFGLTGTLLTWTGTAENTTLALALAMGGGSMLLTHSVFTWLRRSESAVDALSDMELEGRAARAVLPLAPGGRGRVVCLIADREQYVIARLAPDAARPVEAGSEVVIVRIEDGVAEVVPFEPEQLGRGAETPELPPPES